MRRLTTSDEVPPDARGPEPRAPRRRLARLASAAGLVAVLAVGAAIRLSPWDVVFTPGGVRFTVDTDPHYHVLRAQRAIAEWPRVAPRDPWLDYPNGVDVMWPPLFDASIAAAAEVIGAGHPTPELVERVAAFVPVVLGLATLAVVALLGGALFGGGLWLDAALVLALLPLHARFSMVGRPDQHVAEVLLFCCVLLGFARSWRPRARVRSAAALGVLLCVAFWTWQGSALNLLVLGGILAGWHVLAPRDDRVAEGMAFAVAVGGGVGAVLLLLSLAAFGPAGAVLRMSLTGLSGFAAVLCAMLALFAVAILLARRRWPAATRPARLVQLAAAGAVCALPFALPPLWPPLRQGLMAFARSGPWYSTISEFGPMFGQYPLSQELPYRFAQLGLTPLVAPLAAFPLARRWRERPEDGPGAFALLLGLGAFLFLAVARVRFGAYLTPFLALGTAVLARAAARGVAQRFGWSARWSAPLLVGAVVAIVALPRPAHVERGLVPEGLGNDEVLVSTLRRLGAIAPADPARPAVFARWPVGHLIRYYAGKPVVTNGFGTEGGETSLDDWGAFAFARDPEAAERILERRRIGFLVLDDPSEVIQFDLPFAPEGTPPLLSQPASGHALPLPAVYDLAVSRLYVFHGSERPGRTERGLGHHRLLLESPESTMARGLKVFGWVPGCRLSIATSQPNDMLRASVVVSTNLRRAFEWKSSAGTDARGRTELLVPYASGFNGYVLGGAYELKVGAVRATALVPEACVTSGGTLEVDVGSGSAR